MNRHQRRAAAAHERQDVAGSPDAPRGKYVLNLHTDPATLESQELAVLISTTTHLATLDKLPGFDPTTVHVKLEFPSGRTGCAQLKLPD